MIPDYGKYAMINMHSWMFLSSYEGLRNSIIRTQSVDSLLHLGPHTFDEISGEIVQNASFVITKNKENQEKKMPNSFFYRLIDGNNSSSKEQLFLNAIASTPSSFEYIKQMEFFVKIPGCGFAYWASHQDINCFERGEPISTKLDCLQGIITGNTERYLKLWYEVNSKCLLLHSKEFNDQMYWVSYTKGGSVRKWYGNNDFVIFWKNDGNYLIRNRNTNSKYYLKPCFTWSLIGSNRFSTRFCDVGFLWDVSGSIGVPYNEQWKQVLGFMNSKLVSSFLYILNPTINTNIEDIDALPFIPSEATVIDDFVVNNISISKLDWDSHETSWDFKTNELYRLALGLTYEQVESSLMTNVGLSLSLEDVVSRYTQFWQEKFMQLHRNEEELNRKFIEIYGLQDELTPDVPLDEITILQKGEISIEDNQIVWHKDVVIKQFISWMVGCFMGRYSADKPGLIIASQGQKVEDLDLPAMTLEIDDDGIIPIIQESDFFTDDMTQRIEAGMKALFGERNFYDNMKYIKACLGQDLREYLYKDFYNDHLQMYSVKGAKRPIYWLFSSKMGDKKKKGYFKVLVYMHRIESDTLSKLHADYVSPYIDKVEQHLKEAEDDAVRDDLSQAQRNKANKLAAELAEKVREVKEFATILAQMSTQRLSIDLDDGVKTNYPKYYPLVEPIKGLDKEE